MGLLVHSSNDVDSGFNSYGDERKKRMAGFSAMLVKIV